jgi:hypothetical protein
LHLRKEQVASSGFSINVEAEKVIKAALKQMDGLDKRCTTISQQGLNAQYVKESKIYNLPVFTSEYGCCSCFRSIDGFFCKHQLLALWVSFLWYEQPSSAPTATFALSTSAQGWMPRVGVPYDNIEALISKLECSFLRSSGNCSATTAHLGVPQQDDEAQSYPPTVAAEHTAPKGVPLTPGSRLMKCGPQPDIEAFSAILQQACHRDTPTHVRPHKLAPAMSAFLKQTQHLLEVGAVAANEHAQAFGKPSGHLTVHRQKSASEKRRRKVNSPMQGVHSFA